MSGRGEIERILLFTILSLWPSVKIPKKTGRMTPTLQKKRNSTQKLFFARKLNF